MAFHRFTQPSYAGGLRSGDDYVNNRTSGTPAAAAGPLSAGANIGSYFYGSGESFTQAAINRGFKALAENTDFLDDQIVAVQAALSSFISATNTTVGTLSATVAALAGASGSNNVGAPAVAGTPFALTAGTLTAQLAAINANANTAAAATTAVAGRATSLETRATNVEGRATTLEGLTTFGLGSRDPSHVGLRLSLSSTLSVPTADIVGTSTLYLRAHEDETLWLWDSTNGWMLRNGGAASLALTGMVTNAIYDVFAYWDGTAVQLELGTAWAGDTTPPTLTSFSPGIRVKAGGAAGQARRFIGSIRATGTTLVEDSASKRFIYNEYNQVDRHLLVSDANSWTYGSGTVRVLRGQTTNTVAAIVRRPTPFSATAIAQATPPSASSSYNLAIGLDSVTAAATLNKSTTHTIATSQGSTLSHAILEDVLTPGYHFLAGLENIAGTASTTSVQGINNYLRTRLRM